MESKEKENLREIREITGAGVMDTRRAYIEARGDKNEAIRILKERGLIRAEKRSGRETGAGLVQSYVHNGRIGVLLDVRAETDFVVRSEPFQKLAHELAMQIAASAPRDVDNLLSQPYIKDESRTVKDLINEAIAKVGENITVNKFYRLEI